MVSEKGFPQTMIALENGLFFAGRKKRSDARIYLPGGEILMLIEFKAPQIKLNQETILQAAVYAGILNPQFIMLSNGIEHFWIPKSLENPHEKWKAGIPHLTELNRP